ncbi:MAG: hypothetical protein ACE5HO_10895 [bacterium]
MGNGVAQVLADGSLLCTPKASNTKAQGACFRGALGFEATNPLNPNGVPQNHATITPKHTAYRF